MRITYNNGELNLSMTHDEAEHIYKNKGRTNITILSTRIHSHNENG